MLGVGVRCAEIECGVSWDLIMAFAVERREVLRSEALAPDSMRGSTRNQTETILLSEKWTFACCAPCDA